MLKALVEEEIKRGKPKEVYVGRLDLRVVVHYESTCPNCERVLVFMENPQGINMTQMYCRHCNSNIILGNPYMQHGTSKEAIHAADLDS